MIVETELRSRCAEELDNLLGDGPYSLDEAGLLFLNFIGYTNDEISPAVEELTATGGVRIERQGGVDVLSRTQRWWINLSTKVVSSELPEAVRNTITYYDNEDAWQLGADAAAILDAVVRTLLGTGFSRSEVVEVFHNYAIGQSLGFLRTDAQHMTLEHLISRAAATPTGREASPLVESRAAPVIESQPVKVSKTPRLPSGTNFEVVKVVRTPPPRAAYRITIRRTDEGTEGTIVLSPSRLISKRLFGVACINALNFFPTLSDRVAWIDFAEGVMACAEPPAELPASDEDIAKPYVAPAKLLEAPAKPHVVTVWEEYEEVDKLLVRVVEDVLGKLGPWTGTATQLLDIITSRVFDPPTGWPHSAATLGLALRRCAYAINSLGIHMAFRQKGGGNRDRYIQLRLKT